MSVSDRARFTEGDCHYLARAIHRRTGWPMAAFSDGEGFPDVHAFVIMPDGRPLDIDGAHDSMEKFMQRWEISPHGTIHTFEVFDWQTLRAFGEESRRPVFGQATYHRARVVAGRLLDSVRPN